MGACLILTPVVISAWPALASVVVAAAASLGYSTAKNLTKDLQAEVEANADGILLAVPGSQVISEQLGRDEKLRVTRDGVTITFRRDARGAASLHVTGPGRSHDDLQRLGEEMSQRVVREYVRQQLRSEMEAHGFTLVEETEDESHAIQMTVRRWEN